MQKETILAGHHRPHPFIPRMILNPMGNKRIEKVFRFEPDSNIWEWFNDPNKDGDYSKLMGFVNGFFIHQESYRIGICSLANGKCDIAAYVYQNGMRLETRTLITIDPKKFNQVRLIIETEEGRVIKFSAINETLGLGYRANEIAGEAVFMTSTNKKIGFTTGVYWGGGMPDGKDWTPAVDITFWTEEKKTLFRSYIGWLIFFLMASVFFGLCTNLKFLPASVTDVFGVIAICCWIYPILLAFYAIIIGFINVFKKIFA